MSWLGQAAGWRAGIAALCAGLAACAHTRAPREPSLPTLDGERFAVALSAWDALERGQVARAAALLRGRARPEPLGDLLEAMLAQEALDARTAITRLLRALDGLTGQHAAAPRDSALVEALATAALGRLQAALREEGDASSEAVVLDLPADRLPWRARQALLALVEEFGRRRGDRALIEARARAHGCLPADSLTRPGRLGRLPISDLLRPEPPGSPGEPGGVAVVGCTIALLGGEGLAGVERLRARVTVARGGPYELVLDRDGLAAVRVDGGGWRRHGDPARPPMRWSRFAFLLAPGVHEVDVRLASHGDGGVLALALRPASSADHSDAREPPWLAAVDWMADAPAARGDPRSRLAALLSGLAAEQAGHTDLLAARALLLAGADEDATAAVNPLVRGARARWLLADPGLPASVARDRARRVLARALPEPAARWEARAELAAATLEYEDGRYRPAERLARRALARAPASPGAGLALYRALAALELRQLADEALAGALQALPAGARGALACVLHEQAAQRAAARGHAAEEEAHVQALAACDASSPRRALWLRARGRLDEAEAELARLSALDPTRAWLARERAELLVAGGRLAEAEQLLVELARREPRDGWVRVQLADVRAALARRAGAAQDAAAIVARQVLARALEELPLRPEVRRAARLYGLPGPMDEFRLDGRAVIAAYRDHLREPAVAQVLSGPAVMVLDRLVERLLPDGGRLLLTHTIVQVHGKDALARWGEITLPPGAEVLQLRTIKADGRVLVPESIGGKDSVSAPELEPGDFVEWETLEGHGPAPAFAPGFLGARFFFQSFDLPFARSEYWLVHPEGVDVQIDRRAGAPAPARERRTDGSWLVRFEARDQPQRFVEPAAVPTRELLPSVRLGSGAILDDWRAFVRERLATAARGSVEIDALARRAWPAGAPRAEQLVAWIARHIESEGDADGSASATLARGRGSRVALALALARASGLEVEALLARSLEVDPAGTAGSPLDVEDFSQVVLGLHEPGAPPRYTDLRGRHVLLGVLPPALHGAAALPLMRASATPVELHGEVDAGRTVTAELHLDVRGDARVEVVERLSGTPVRDWLDYLERLAGDVRKLRREFERGWLSRALPGAALGELSVDDREAEHGRLVLRYTADWPAQAQVQDGELSWTPRLFRSELGRRLASEAERVTALDVGYDVPLTIDATIFLPPGSTVLSFGSAGTLAWPPGPGDGLRFVEERALWPMSGAAADRPVVALRRRVRVPYLWVSPADYPALAPLLRRSDELESAPIRARLERAR